MIDLITKFKLSFSNLSFFSNFFILEFTNIPHFYTLSRNNKSLKLNEINVADRSKSLSSSKLIISQSNQQQEHYHHYRNIFSTDSIKQSTSLNCSYKNILFGHHNKNDNIGSLPQAKPSTQPSSSSSLIVSSFNPSYAAVVASSSNSLNSPVTSFPSNSSSLSIGSIKKVELKSIGTGGSSVIIQNRRVQTNTSTRNQSTLSSQMANNNIMEQSNNLTLSFDTRDSLDGGSGSPGADSGVFSSSMENSTSSSAVANIKYEIIQKDIGYSSDADMSDAIEVSKLLFDLFDFPLISMVNSFFKFGFMII